MEDGVGRMEKDLPGRCSSNSRGREEESVRELFSLVSELFSYLFLYGS